MRIQIAGLVNNELSMDQALDRFFVERDLPKPGGPSVRGWSQTSQLLRCPYAYYLHHVAKLQVDPNAFGSGGASRIRAFGVGGCTHVLLALHYMRMLPTNYPGYIANAPQPQELIEAIRPDAPAEALIMAERLYDGYVERYADECIMPVAIEMPAGDPRFHTCRYDMIAWIEDGLHDGLWIVEHKTASKQTELDLWELDGELLGEAWAWQASFLEEKFGAPLAGICINALVKDAAKPNFQRSFIYYPPGMINNFSIAQEFWVDFLESCKSWNKGQGRWPQNYANCSSRFGRCSFWLHCRNNKDMGCLKPRE